MQYCDMIMPTDVLSSSCRTGHFSNYPKKRDAEVKSGFLVLLASSRQNVRVVVYRTSIEHFAVVYPRKRTAKPICVVNLRNTSVERVDGNGFVVRHNSHDNTISAKFRCSENDLLAWMTAFTPRSECQQRFSLPVLNEGEEIFET